MEKYVKCISLTINKNGNLPGVLNKIYKVIEEKSPQD